MPLESPLASLAERVDALNHRFRHHSAAEVLRHALSDPQIGPVALVSSFGAESVVLLHMISRIDRSLPVIFLDTEMLFAETLAYQRDVARRLRLTDLRIIRPDREEMFRRDPDGLLHRARPDACCALRKVEPLARALSGFDGWISGRKRFHGGRRQDLEFFEAGEDGRIKINPLAHWSREDVQAYIDNNNLPRHPLVAKGFASIGCAPCTTPVDEGEEVRAGRWRGFDKAECGIHIENGRVVRLKDREPEKVIVTDAGFGPDDWPGGIDIGPDTPPEDLPEIAAGAEAIRIAFPAFSDGRGFSLARQLRRLGFAGRLRAAGHVLADQYAMARRSGFDEVEISPDLAARQDESQWKARANWRDYDYRSRLRARL